MGAGSNGDGAAIGNDAQLRRLIAEIDAEIAAIRGAQANVYSTAFKDLGRATIAGTFDVYQGFGESTVGRLRAAQKSFVTKARKEIWTGGFAEWTDRFDDAAGTLRAGMKRSMTKAQLNGWGQRQLANDFLKHPDFTFENLPEISERAERVFNMGGKLKPADALKRRAHVIARTELNGTANQMHLDWTTEAGFDKYMNINSDPVAQVCKDANAAGEQTREWWDGGLGFPPRHPNCDSGMLAVA